MKIAHFLLQGFVASYRPKGLVPPYLLFSVLEPLAYSLWAVLLVKENCISGYTSRM